MQDLIWFELNSKALYYKCKLLYLSLKMLNLVPEVINFGFSNPDKKKLISSKKRKRKNLKMLLPRKKILLNILTWLSNMLFLYRNDLEKCP